MNGYRPTAIIEQYTNSATLPADQRTRAELFFWGDDIPVNTLLSSKGASRRICMHKVNDK